MKKIDNSEIPGYDKYLNSITGQVIYVKEGEQPPKVTVEKTAYGTATSIEL